MREKSLAIVTIAAAGKSQPAGNNRDELVSEKNGSTYSVDALFVG
jgi:hypothetical protein